MLSVECPHCGEDERLRGDKNVSNKFEHIAVVCESCGFSWTRDLTPRCMICGSVEVRPALRSIVQKSRGTQLSIESLSVEYLCPSCNSRELEAWNKSNTPLPPTELP